ncbi:LysR family transcriptional regulator [Cloacibacillus evryensis]
MEIHQLKYALAVAKNRSFVRAAYELCITPPALSQQIKKLEDELGIILFERTTRNTRLTPAGTELIEITQDIISSLGKIDALKNKYHDAEEGHISLGIFPTMGPYGLMALLSTFQNTFPKIKLDLYEAECIELNRMLQKGTIDAAFSTYADKEQLAEETDSYPLVWDKLVLVTSAHHPFAARKKINLIEAKDEEFIMPPKSSGAYIEMMGFCHSLGFEPKTKYHSTSNLTRFGLIAEGLGISFASSTVAVSYMVHNISIVEFEPRIPRTLSLWAFRAKQTPQISNFIEFCQRWAETRRAHFV